MTTPAFLALLIDAIAKTVPAAPGQTEADRAANLHFARTLLEAFQPTDALQAAMAARAIATHLAVMDSFARAAKPDLDDDTVIRLRANAIAGARGFDALLRSLDRQRQPAPAVAEPKAPAPTGNAKAQASRVYHRAELPPLIPGLPDPLAATARNTRWRDGTALAPVQPTVFTPG
jgi:hypothetical protein